MEVCDVLIVDDDPDIREVLAELLTGEGYSVATAVDGRRAMLWLQSSGRPCVILLDLMMPVMSGQDFRDAQLASPELADVPVVVISASENLEGLGDAFAGVPRLPKPLELDDLLQEIAPHCRQRAP